MNVLSLFDGMSGGQMALRRAGIPYDKYFASEVDKNAIKITQHHYPETIQLGCVTGVHGGDLPKIDLLMGGSPCQGFSYSGKMLNFNDPRSRLFFDFARLVEECQPRHFLLENVVMKQEYQDVISGILGVQPIEINSSLVSAQNRRRLYWSSLPITQPFDTGVILDDIVETDVGYGPAAVRGRRLTSGTIVGRRVKDNGVRADNDTTIPISQCLEVRSANRGKSNCLTTVEKDNVLTPLPVGRHKDAFKDKLPFRYYTLKEYCRLQTVPDDHFDGVLSDSAAKKIIGNGWTIDVIAHILRGMV